MSEGGQKAVELEGPTFEQRLGRLEAIVQELEREDLELETTLRLFEEGVGHLRHARAMLDQAALRVERLVEEADGAVVARPLESESDGGSG